MSNNKFASRMIKYLNKTFEVINNKQKRYTLLENKGNYKEWGIFDHKTQLNMFGKISKNDAYNKYKKLKDEKYLVTTVVKKHECEWEW